MVLWLYWTNPGMAWNPQDYGNVTHVLCAAQDIWMPDIVLYLNEDFKDRASSQFNVGNFFPVCDKFDSRRGNLPTLKLLRRTTSRLF